MKLAQLLAVVPHLPFPDPELSGLEITGLAVDSRACKPGDLFLGIPGLTVDGGEFWAQALTQGASAALISPQAYQKCPPGSPRVLAIPDVGVATARIAACFFGYPSEALQLVGVTGTNGKTTTTHLLEYFLKQQNQVPALLGTLYQRWPGFEQAAQHTTPFATQLQDQLAQARSAGCTHGVMEVSSHALAQDRVLGCRFAVAVFTNLTQDHLDFHQTMEAYYGAKAKLFSPEYLRGTGVVNADDPYGQRLLATLESGLTYSTQQPAHLWTSHLSYNGTGVEGQLHTPTGTYSFTSPLVGGYNLENLLGALGALRALDLDLESALASLPGFPGVPGRMERVQVSPEQDLSVIVDYAHTPDGLANVLRATRPFVQGRLVCVFGCGGDRDRRKRPQMGEIAAQLADRVIVTADNPRTEDPGQIFQDILAGMPGGTTLIPDRAQAIETAISEAQPRDVVLIAGKGHEDYQILGREKFPFDDRQEARRALLKRYGGRC